MKLSLFKTDSSPGDTTRWVTRAPRRDADFHVEITGPTTAPFTGVVRNISSSGMLIIPGNDLAVGDIVTATMPVTGDVMCRVMRTGAKGAGVRFLDRVDDTAVALWSEERARIR